MVAVGGERGGDCVMVDVGETGGEWVILDEKTWYSRVMLMG